MWTESALRQNPEVVAYFNIKLQDRKPKKAKQAHLNNITCSSQIAKLVRRRAD